MALKATLPFVKIIGMNVVKAKSTISLTSYDIGIVKLLLNSPAYCGIQDKPSNFKNFLMFLFCILFFHLIFGKYTCHQVRMCRRIVSCQISLKFSSFLLVTVCRECGWRTSESLATCQDPCVVCLERKCTVAAEGR